jgi:hypothetical protein
MNAFIRNYSSSWRLAATALALLMLGACTSKEAAAPAPGVVAEADARVESGLVLDPQQIAKLGVVAQPAKAASYMAEDSGYGQVMVHDSIALLAAEIATADAAVRQSSAALTRMRQLAGTPGAFPADALENAERQAAADTAALNLSRQKLSAALGQRGPWNTESGGTLLSQLSTGQLKLVRASFPSGAFATGNPRRLRMAHFSSGGKTRDWQSDTVWEAPADASVPGRSFFALLRGSDASEGERLQVWASTGGASEAGVLIPAAAVVLSNDAWWCYVEKPAGTFARVAVDISRPLDGGYFASQGIAAGDSIVTAAAGLLLARELNPSTEAE